MENASKALIIAGAILISILLISVGILVFNSTREFTDNASATDDTMELAAALENAKIVLGTMDIEDDDTFNNYIISRYGNGRKLTTTEVRELAALIIERTKKIGKGKFSIYVTHITSDSSQGKVYYATSYEEYKYDLEEDKLYQVVFKDTEGRGKSVRIKLAN